MTKIEFFRKNGDIIRYKASGHSGYAEEGSDIICASISTVLQLPLMSLTEVLKTKPKFKINKDGFLEVDLREINKADYDKIYTLLETVVLFIKELSKQYPKNIKLVEKEER